MDNLDKYLNIANEEKKKHGLDDYAPLYPMFRLEDEKLYVAVMLTSMDQNVWDINGNVIPKYWMLIDVKTNEVVKFNEDDSYIEGDIIKKGNNDKQKEISKFIVEKKLQYKNYFLEDMKSDRLLLIQDKVSSLLNNKVNVDGDEVNIDEYLFSQVKDEVEEKINELVDILVTTKYGTITYYYDILIKNIVDEYVEKQTINKEKLKLCIEIMNKYYDGVIGIENFFNI